MFKSNTMTALSNRAARTLLRVLAGAGLAAALTVTAVPTSPAASNQAYLRIPNWALGT
jgi:hypothetical protein